MRMMFASFRHPAERGQAIVIIVFALVGAIALVGLAMDGGHALADRRQAQNAADSAALAAALAYVNGQSLDDAAIYRAKSNGYPNNGSRSIVKAEHPPATGTYSCEYRSDCEDFIQVNITSNIDTWFASIVGVKTLTNNVFAIAKAKKTVSVPLYDGAALVALNPMACRSFYFTGSSTTVIKGSGVFVNSSCSDSNPLSPQQAFYSSGNGHAQAPWIKVVGGAHYREGDLNLEQPLATGVSQYPAIRELYNLPDLDCGSPGEIDENNSSVAWPGAYEGFPPEGVHEMMPGKYCVNSLHINSNLSGEDVLIVTKGTVFMNGNAGISLKAKTQGPYAGLLIYLAPTHDYEKQQPVTINGNSGLELTGTILAPSSDITINGTGKKDRVNSQIIGDTISISGNENMLISYQDENNFDATTPALVEIVK